MLLTSNDLSCSFEHSSPSDLNSLTPAFTDDQNGAKRGNSSPTICDTTGTCWREQAL